MSSLPVWPHAPGPRILMLVANDLTIDSRVRKTASSLARLGFSVIGIGVDAAGRGLQDEDLDGALLVRVAPSLDPRISPRILRLSRPEMTDALRYRAEIRRQRLQSSRRTLSADVTWAADNPSRWTSQVGRLGTATARMFGMPEEIRAKVGRRLTIYARKIERAVRFGPRKALTVASQGFHQLSTLGYRILGRPSRPLFGGGSWRRDLPELHRHEAAIGPLIDALQPDLVHVHDVFHLGVAARAKTRARSAGRHVALVYDAHEYVSGLPIDPRRRDAYADLETEYYDRADAAVTVSDGLADLLEARYRRRPAVVMNAPDMDNAVPAVAVRKVAGVPDNSNLIIYVGGIAPHRGAETLIEAMTRLDANAHLVFVANSTTGYVAGLLELSERHGLTNRVHIAPYVPPEAVVDYIRSADVSAIPLSREFMNYEIALPNKLFQSIQAGVPVAVSDNPEMERFVTKNGVGEVFTSGNPEALAQALKTILSNRERYSPALADPEFLEATSWKRQMESLIEVYKNLGVEWP